MSGICFSTSSSSQTSAECLAIQPNSDTVYPETAVIQWLSHVWLCATPWTATHQASLSFTISQSLLKLMSMESVMLSNHFILMPPSPFDFDLSQHQSFLMSHLSASGGQSIRASASVLPMNIQDWFPLGLSGVISLQSKGLSNSTVKSINSLALSILYSPSLTSMHDYLKNYSFD